MLDTYTKISENVVKFILTISLLIVYIRTENVPSINKYDFQTNIGTALTLKVTPLTSKVTNVMAMQSQ